MAKKSLRAARGSGRSVPVMLLVGTRKGAFIYRSDVARKKWRVDGPHFLGNIINHLVLDPRDGRTLLLAAKTGHLGPTVFRSLDGGRSWKEAKHVRRIRPSRPSRAKSRPGPPSLVALSCSLFTGTE